MAAVQDNEAAAHAEFYCDSDNEEEKNVESNGNMVQQQQQYKNKETRSGFVIVTGGRNTHSADKVNHQNNNRNAIEELRRAKRRNSRQQNTSQLTSGEQQQMQINQQQQKQYRSSVKNFQHTSDVSENQISILKGIDQIKREQCQNIQTPSSSNGQQNYYRQLQESAQLPKMSSYRTQIMQNSLAPSHGSVKRKKYADEVSNESSVRVNLKTVLSNKGSGSKNGTNKSCSTKQSPHKIYSSSMVMNYELAGLNPQIVPAKNNNSIVGLQQKSASPTVRRAIAMPMNTSTKKLAQIQRRGHGSVIRGNGTSFIVNLQNDMAGSDVAVNSNNNQIQKISQRHSNMSDDTPGFKLSLDNKVMLLAHANQPPESPGFIFSATASSGKNQIQSQMIQKSSSQTASREGGQHSQNFGIRSNESSSNNGVGGGGGNIIPYRVGLQKTQDSKECSSHFRIAPGYSASFNSGTHDHQSTSPKLTSQQTFGASQRFKYHRMMTQEGSKVDLNNISQGKSSYRNQTEELNTDEFVQDVSTKNATTKILILGQQQSQEWQHGTQTSPQKQSIDDTMKNLVRHRTKIISPEVASFNLAATNGAKLKLIKINQEVGVNLQLNQQEHSESSLVTSYNSDAGGDLLRVGEPRRAMNKTSTKRSMTSPSSSFKQQQFQQHLSPTRAREALDRINRYHKKDLKRMYTNQNEQNIRLHIIEGNSSSKASNSRYIQTDCGSKGSRQSKSSSAKQGVFGIKPTLKRKRTSLASPQLVNSDKVSGVTPTYKFSQNSQSKSRSNSRSSNVKAQNNEQQLIAEDQLMQSQNSSNLQLSFSQPPSPMTNHKSQLNLPKTSPDFETIKDKSNSGASIQSQQVAKDEQQIQQVGHPLQITSNHSQNVVVDSVNRIIGVDGVSPLPSASVNNIPQAQVSKALLQESNTAMTGQSSSVIPSGKRLDNIDEVELFSNHGVDDQDAFDEATRKFTYFGAQGNPDEFVSANDSFQGITQLTQQQTPGLAQSQDENSLLDKNNNGNKTGVMKQQTQNGVAGSAVVVVNPPAGAHKSILACVPENEEENKIDEEHSSQNSIKVLSNEMQKGNFTKKINSHRKSRSASQQNNKHKFVRAQKSMIMQPSAMGSFLEQLQNLPLRQQQTTTAFSNNLGNDASHSQISSSTSLNDNTIMMKDLNSAQIAQYKKFNSSKSGSRRQSQAGRRQPTPSHFTQQIFNQQNFHQQQKQHQQQRRNNRKLSKMNGGQSQEIKNMRLLHSPQGSLVKPQSRIQDKDKQSQQPNPLIMRSQSSSRKSANLREEHKKQLNDVIIQIDSIFSSLMTPANRRSKCNCGNSSNTHSVHYCNSSRYQNDKTSKSDVVTNKNNFTSYLEKPTQKVTNNNNNNVTTTQSSIKLISSEEVTIQGVDIDSQQQQTQQQYKLQPQKRTSENLSSEKLQLIVVKQDDSNILRNRIQSGEGEIFALSSNENGDQTEVRQQDQLPYVSAIISPKNGIDSKSKLQQKGGPQMEQQHILSQMKEAADNQSNQTKEQIYQSDSTSKISEEIEDYTQYDLSGQQPAHNLMYQMLKPEKTCKTIRELSIENDISSMGNISAHVSPQITSVKNMSINSKNAGSIIGTSHRKRRRQSEINPKSDMNVNTSDFNLQNMKDMIKLSHTQNKITRQKTTQLQKQGEENSPQPLVSLLQKQNSLTGLSEIIESKTSGKIAAPDSSTEQRKMLITKQRKLQYGQGFINSKISTSQITCTECGSIEDDSPRGSQNKEIVVDQEKQSQQQQQLNTNLKINQNFMSSPFRNSVQLGALVSQNFTVLHPNDLDQTNMKQNPKKLAYLQCPKGHKRRSKTVKNILKTQQSLNYTEASDIAEENNFNKKKTDLFNKSTNNTALDGNAVQIQPQKSLLKSGNSTNNQIEISQKSVQFEPFTPKKEHSRVKTTSVDFEIIATDVDVNSKENQSSAEQSPLLRLSQENHDYSQMVQQFLQVTQQSSEKKREGEKLLNGSGQQLNVKMIKTGSIREVSSPIQPVFLQMNKEGSQQTNGVTSSNFEGHSLAETAHFLPLINTKSFSTSQSPAGSSPFTVNQKGSVRQESNDTANFSKTFTEEIKPMKDTRKLISHYKKLKLQQNRANTPLNNTNTTIEKTIHLKLDQNSSKNPDAFLADYGNIKMEKSNSANPENTINQKSMVGIIEQMQTKMQKHSTEPAKITKIEDELNENAADASGNNVSFSSLESMAIEDSQSITLENQQNQTKQPKKTMSKKQSLPQQAQKEQALNQWPVKKPGGKGLLQKFRRAAQKQEADAQIRTSAAAKSIVAVIKEADIVFQDSNSRVMSPTPKDNKQEPVSEVKVLEKSPESAPAPMLDLRIPQSPQATTFNQKKSILKNSSQILLPSVEEEFTDGYMSSLEKRRLSYSLQGTPEMNQIQLSIQKQDSNKITLPKIEQQPLMVMSHSESPVKPKWTKVCGQRDQNSSPTPVNRRIHKRMRLIKEVSRVFESRTPQQTQKFGEIFDLSRAKNILNHLQESKLVDEQLAFQIDNLNKKKLEETVVKVQNESKLNSNNASTRQQATHDYHQHIDNSTPSAYRSSIKLQFGTSSGFQDYQNLCNLDNYEMTPSNYYNNHNERNSMSSEAFTQGESSVALPPFSEYFNPELVEFERVVDSNDQSPMGKSQSQLSEYNFKMSSNKGGNTKDIISKKKYGSYSISDVDLQKNQISQENDTKKNYGSYSISDVDFQRNQNIQVEHEKIKYNSIAQNSILPVSRDQSSTPMSDQVRIPSTVQHQTIIDSKKSSHLVNMQLQRPQANNTITKDHDDQVSATSQFSQNYNFKIISHREDTSEESSRLTSNISRSQKLNSKSSLNSKKELYMTAEPQQRPSEQNIESHKQEQLLKTAEKTKPKDCDNHHNIVGMQNNTTGTVMTQDSGQRTKAANKGGYSNSKVRLVAMAKSGSTMPVNSASDFNDQQRGDRLELPKRRITANPHLQRRSMCDQNHQKVSFRDPHSSQAIYSELHKLSSDGGNDVQLHPDLIPNIPEDRAHEFKEIVKQHYNVLHFPVKEYIRTSTVRSCATVRRIPANELSSRLKTEGQISQNEKETLSENLLNESQLMHQKRDSTEDGETFSRSSSNVNHRIYQQQVAASMQHQQMHQQQHLYSRERKSSAFKPSGGAQSSTYNTTNNVHRQQIYTHMHHHNKSVGNANNIKSIINGSEPILTQDLLVQNQNWHIANGGNYQTHSQQKFNNGNNNHNHSTDSVKNMTQSRRSYMFKQNSTPTNLNSKRRIQTESQLRQQTSEVKSVISKLRRQSITTISCVSTKVCGKERINNYQMLQKIGTGAFSEVYRCYDTETNHVYAMKVMNKNSLRRKTISPTLNAFHGVKQEMAIMKKIDHPYILKLFEIINDPKEPRIYLIIEYSKNGSVQKKIEKLQRKNRKTSKKIIDDGQVESKQTTAQLQQQRLGLPEDTMRKYFSQMILALEYCHNELKIIHRDIKPDNLLIDAHDNIKLSDFGVSQQLLEQDGNDNVKSNAGSAYFYSPEACIGTMYRGRMNDIWACGITLYYMATGKYPFESSEHTKLFRLIQNTEPDYQSQLIGTPLHDLICKLLVKQPEDRITIAQIKEHPWITKDGTQPVQDVNYNVVFENPTEAEVQQPFTTEAKREKYIIHRKIQDNKSAIN